MFVRRSYPTAGETARIEETLRAGGWWSIEEIGDVSGIRYRHVSIALRTLCWKGMAERRGRQWHAIGRRARWHATDAGGAERTLRRRGG